MFQYQKDELTFAWAIKITLEKEEPAKVAKDQPFPKGYCVRYRKKITLVRAVHTLMIPAIIAKGGDTSSSKFAK